jgi:hypothetical protein
MFVADSPHTGALNRQGSKDQDDLNCILQSWVEQPVASDPWNSTELAPGVAWASQTEPLSSEPVDEQFSYSTQDYSNFDTPRGKSVMPSSRSYGGMHHFDPPLINNEKALLFYQASKIQEP